MFQVEFWKRLSPKNISNKFFFYLFIHLFLFIFLFAEHHGYSILIGSYWVLTRQNVAVSVFASVGGIAGDGQAAGLGLVRDQGLPLAVKTILVLHVVLHVRLNNENNTQNVVFHIYVLLTKQQNYLDVRLNNETMTMTQQKHTQNVIFHIYCFVN